MQPLEDAVDSAATRTGFSGVVRVDRGDEMELAKAYGLADRAHAIPNTVETLFATASATKGFTALTVMSLVEDGTLELTTTVRSVLGDDLPLIADDVTLEHLMAHRSGIGDYLDEDEVESVTDYVMPVPVHRLATTEAFLEVLDGHETVFPGGGAVRVQQWRLRRAGVDRRARERGALPRPGPTTRVRARRHGGHRVPPLG